MYKNLLFYLCCFLLSPVWLLAQRGGDRDNGPSFSWSGDGLGNGIPTQFAITAGTSYAAVSPAGASSLFVGKHGFETGFKAGISMGIPVTARFSVRPALVATEMNTGDRKLNYQVRLWYLDMPVLGSISVDELNRFRLLTGPSLGLLLSARQSDNGSVKDIRQSLRQENLSWVAGAEWLPGRFGVALQYAHGLNNIFSAVAKANGSADYGARTRCFSLSLVCIL